MKLHHILSIPPSPFSLLSMLDCLIDVVATTTLKWGGGVKENKDVQLAGDFLLGLMFSSAVISPTIIHIFCLNRLVEFGSRYVEFQGLILFYFPFNR